MNIIVPEKESVFELSIIQNIHEIRGYKVMLDFDLAQIYGTETKYLKRAVRNNIERFEGEDFMFELTKEEYLRCKNCTLNKSGRGKHIKYLPYAFTREGVAMLSSVLRSEQAIRMNRKIMRAFVAIYQYALNYADLKRDMELYMNKTDREISDIHTVLDVLMSHKQELEKPRNPIGFKINS